MQKNPKIQSLIFLIVLFSRVSLGFSDETITRRDFPSDSVFQMSFKSKIDATVQPFLAKTPKDYDPKKKWPLLVVLHGLGDGPILAPHISSMLQIGPFGRGDFWYEGIGEQDVLECLDVAQIFFSVDKDKIFLCGFSMGATGTFKLGLKYPDLWAACVPVCGRSESPQLISNAKNLPFWIHCGSKDKVVSPFFSRRVWQSAVELNFDHWKFTEHTNKGHSFSINWIEVENWLAKQKRVSSPAKINFTSIDRNARRAWWLEILTAKNPKMPARIQSEIQGQSITVETSNVSRYQLFLADVPLEATSPITIIENGQLVFLGHIPIHPTFISSPADLLR